MRKRQAKKNAKRRGIDALAKFIDWKLREIFAGYSERFAAARLKIETEPPHAD